MSSQLPAPANPAHMFVRLRRSICRGSLVRRQYFDPQTPPLSYSISALRFSDQLSNYEKNRNLSSVIFQSSLRSRSVKYSSKLLVNPSSAAIIVPGADPWRVQAQSLLVLDRWHSNSSQSRSVEISSIVLGNPMCSVLDCDFWSRSSERLSAVLSNTLSVFISVNKSAPVYGEGDFAKVFDQVIEEEFSENNDQHEGLEKRQQVQSRLVASDYLEANLDLMDILISSYEKTYALEDSPFLEENLQLPQFIKSSHIQFVVFVRREFQSSKLQKHLSRILQCILQFVRIQSAMHVEGVLLKACNPGGEPFLEDEISLELKEEEDGECYRMLRSRERSYNGNARIAKLLLGSDLPKCGVDVNAVSCVLLQSCKSSLHTNGYYRDEGRKIKAHIERRNLELNIQYCFKVVVHTEFRRDWGEALRMYDAAYHVLRDIVCTSTRLPPIQCVVEIKTIAKQLNFNWQAMAMAAASLAYGSEKKNNEITLVFDLGGGTFDVSVIEVGDGVFEMLSTSGDTHLGGDDFDKRIGDWLSSNFKEDDGIDLLEFLLKLNGQQELLEFQSH